MLLLKVILQVFFRSCNYVFHLLVSSADTTLSQSLRSKHIFWNNNLATTKARLMIPRGLNKLNRMLRTFRFVTSKLSPCLTISSKEILNESVCWFQLIPSTLSFFCFASPSMVSAMFLPLLHRHSGFHFPISISSNLHHWFSTYTSRNQVLIEWSSPSSRDSIQHLHFFLLMPGHPHRTQL